MHLVEKLVLIGIHSKIGKRNYVGGFKGFAHGSIDHQADLTPRSLDLPEQPDQRADFSGDDIGNMRKIEDYIFIGDERTGLVAELSLELFAVLEIRTRIG